MISIPVRHLYLLTLLMFCVRTIKSASILDFFGAPTTASADQALPAAAYPTLPPPPVTSDQFPAIPQSTIPPVVAPPVALPEPIPSPPPPVAPLPTTLPEIPAPTYPPATPLPAIPAAAYPQIPMQQPVPIEQPMPASPQLTTALPPLPPMGTPEPALQNFPLALTPPPATPVASPTVAYPELPVQQSVPPFTPTMPVAPPTVYPQIPAQQPMVSEQPMPMPMAPTVTTPTPQQRGGGRQRKQRATQMPGALPITPTAAPMTAPFVTAPQQPMSVPQFATPQPTTFPPAQTPMYAPVYGGVPPQPQPAEPEKFVVHTMETTQEHEKLVHEDESTPLAHDVYLGSYLEPWRHGPDEMIELLFENAELSAFIHYIEEKFKITFLLDDNIKPLPPHGKSILGTKITFKTHVPLSKKQAWDIFVMFLDTAGLAPIPGPTPDVYRLVQSRNQNPAFDASHEPLPTFIGTDISLVPENDSLIRYIYFINTAQMETIVTTIDAIKSVSAPPAIRLPELNAVIITDRALNIRSILQVLQELDQAGGHEGLAVIRLQRADANKAAKMYADFAQQQQGGAAAARTGGRKAATYEYFPRNARVIPDPRTNSLIILGSREAIKVITDFIVNIVEQRDQRPDAPTYVYTLKYLDSDNMAAILSKVTKFKEGSDAAASGGVRDGDKYFKAVSITSEPTTNSLIISADYEDYTKLHDLIQSLDIEQPQVALRLFILSISSTDDKGFGVQMRNKVPGPNTLIGNNTSYQNSGLAETNPQTGIVENNTLIPGAARLLGNLATLANNVPIGSTVIALGSDVFGVWGMLNMLQTYTKANVVADPFLVTTNKYPAQLVLGETRRVVEANIFATQTQQGFEDLSATLNINITPQVSRDGLITLDIDFTLEQFDDPNVNSTSGNRSVRKLQTSAIVADNEVLALGGLVRESLTENETAWPILGRIPILGWFFKNRTQHVEKVSLLLLVQAEAIMPISNNPSTRQLTETRAHTVRSLATEIREKHGMMDPVNRLFFDDRNSSEERFIEEFMDKKNNYTIPAVLEREQKKLIAAQAPLCREPRRKKGQKKCKNRRCSPQDISESSRPAPVKTQQAALEAPSAEAAAKSKAQAAPPPTAKKDDISDLIQSRRAVPHDK